MDSNSPTSKSAARELAKERLKKLVSPVSALSLKILSFLEPHPVLVAAPRIGLFYPRSFEPDLLELWRARPEAVAFPRVNRTTKQLEFFRVSDLGQMSPGFGGIPEPRGEGSELVKSWTKADVILVPGLAFDSQGGRLGSGLGYYDRFLAECPSQRWGSAFEAQISSVPLAQEPTDARMDALVTEKGWRTVR